MIKLDEKKVEGMLDQHWNWFCTYVLTKKLKIEIDPSDFSKDKEITYEEFINEYFDWDKKALEKIIKVKPNKIKDLADENKEYYKAFEKGEKKVKLNNLKFPIIDDEQKEETKKESKERKYKNHSDVILNLFGYNDFLRGYAPWGSYQKGWGAYAFTKELGVDVCPYCNRQYIFTISEQNIDESKKEKKTVKYLKESKNGRPEIDHFYPKAEYPYLSCSLFNFIPSCHPCNHQKKDSFNKKLNDDNKKKHKNLKFDGDYARLLYPYEEGFSVPKKIAQFKLSRRKCSDLEYNEKKYKIIIEPENDNGQEINNKIKNAIEAFHLEELYNLHQLELDELVEGCRDYSEAKRISLAKMIANAIGNDKTVNGLIEFYKKRIKNIVFSLPRDTAKNYILQQLKEDLVEQFKTIDYDPQKMNIE